MEIQYGNPWALNWLWLALACLAMVIVAAVRTRMRLRNFASDNFMPRLLPPRHRLLVITRAMLMLMTFVLLTIALVDIRWGKVWREIPQKGIEVMFVLDVSRSMLAEDVTPNRLGRAKQQINDMLEVMGGDRIGLVVFAGEVRQVVPMTNHYDDFRRSLKEVDTSSIRRGGSRLGDAIRVATNGFLSKTLDHKAMVILTDGEDQESEPVKAAKQAYQDHGIRIFTVGLGNQQQGARIPSGRNADSSYLQYEGEQVWSKLDGKILQAVATETNGAFIPAETKQVDMASVYRQYVAKVDQQQFETAKINQYEARFQWFLGLALLSFLCDVFAGHWMPKPSGDPFHHEGKTR
ncbi:von Willebrand factor type A domain protein [Novipirellula galeiformis]|uniref:von Willebrand factor type A domain protein n=1 Tax=Novipirellula galeiformis TaxID=2528004 RepID=A0A5C6CLG8_9BACT|nr:VWA domain-containing protein [Novipirellula galeiformis]TWU24407.1 von Willebrand factor type A domain protein [Novipirellula galeiformis]